MTGRRHRIVIIATALSGLLGACASDADTAAPATDGTDVAPAESTEPVRDNGNRQCRHHLGQHCAGTNSRRARRPMGRPTSSGRQPRHGDRSRIRRHLRRVRRLRDRHRREPEGLRLRSGRHRRRHDRDDARRRRPGLRRRRRRQLSLELVTAGDDADAHGRRGRVRGAPGSAARGNGRTPLASWRVAIVWASSRPVRTRRTAGTPTASSPTVRPRSPCRKVGPSPTTRRQRCSWGRRTTTRRASTGTRNQPGVCGRGQTLPLLLPTPTTAAAGRPISRIRRWGSERQTSPPGWSPRRPWWRRARR